MYFRAATVIFLIAALFRVRFQKQTTANPYKDFLTQKSLSPDPLIVDLGYEVYKGYQNETSNLNIWKSIRYAAPPTGSLRWQKPQVPTVNRTHVLSAKGPTPQCPEFDATLSFTLPTVLTGDISFFPEDCLFLEVYTPQGAKDLPVFVWIRKPPRLLRLNKLIQVQDGGGYGEGIGNSSDPSEFMGTNDNGFISVMINHRLGPFGFLASDEVHRFGAVNAGLYDQSLVLEWVQQYIGDFGGDKSKVTIGGFSAGGGSVMLQSLAFGGTRGTRLFQNIIAASPYLPEQWHYSDYIPSQSYYRFAAAAGCINSINITVFDCLLSKNASTLVQAGESVSANGKYGTWGFLPVTDGEFLLERPSEQLRKKKVSGKRMLATHCADEGVLLTPQNIITEEDFLNYVHIMFPLLTPSELDELISFYPSTNTPVDPNLPKFATTGTSLPSALNQSVFGTGQQQRANNLYGESTFVCPSYWLAEAFSTHRKQSWKTQFSVVDAEHVTDQLTIFPPDLPSHGPYLRLAMRKIWGNFIIKGNPSIPLSVAVGKAGDAYASAVSPSLAKIENWPRYNPSRPILLNINQTGGVLEEHLSFENIPVEWYVEPGLRNHFEFADAYTWEAGRGARCDFWKRIGKIVPE
ncbi:related to esterase [Phialocephala subalpina]|uniref:Carboxylic ester hydrolase n=1 Tax=Phialocephala subalpina TaxID=576137 RepID=A0A1L7XLB2_9HELO|nr:related to esterase [Phialocephala subalpina]